MFNIPNILLIFIGLAFAFFGLPIYRGTIKLIGFVVGAAYAIYLFTIFASSLTWEPVFVYLAGALLIIILGVIGVFIAQFANYLMFFLAGGLVGVLLGKFIMGGLTGDVVGQTMSGGFLELIKPQGTDLIWFLGGGLIFVIAVDPLVMIALSALGAGILWYALSPMGLLKPDWAIPVIVGVIGLITQESMRRRARENRIPVQKHPRERTI
ncbi:MAG: hypothetical protein NTY09_04080 [bacterium]|nr:hypothetical protein [bacterium]